MACNEDTFTFTHTTQLHYTNSYTYSHPNLNFLQYTIQIPVLVPHVMWSAQAVHELKIDHTQRHLSALCRTRSTQVQWVGIGTHTHIVEYVYCSAHSEPCKIPREEQSGYSEHLKSFTET